MNRRYELHRSTEADDSRTLAWVMLNPSTADEHHNDPTIRRVMSFTSAAGFGNVFVANLFTVRATDPRELLRLLREDPAACVAGGLAPLRKAAGFGHVVCAWGRPANKRVAARARRVRRYLERSGATLYRLDPPLDGDHPRHPLYAPGEPGLVPWRSP